jgi:hypothetical protein
MTAPFVLRLAAAGLAGLLLLAPVAASAEDLPPETAKAFAAFRNSKTYVDALLGAVMEQDQRLWPSCEKRTPISRTLVEIVRRPLFNKDGKEPTSGFWGERVELDRCGTKGAQTAYFEVRDQIDVAPGLPGRTLANLFLQVDTGKAVIEADLAKEKTCRAREIIDSAVINPPAEPGGRWVERWTVVACGVKRPHDVTFTPKSDGDIAFAVSSPKG